MFGTVTTQNIYTKTNPFSATDYDSCVILQHKTSKKFYCPAGMFCTFISIEKIKDDY